MRDWITTGSKRWLRLVGLMAATVVIVSGCAGKRPDHSKQELMDLRAATEKDVALQARQLTTQMIERTRKEQEAYAAGKSKEPPVIDVLIVSGGGDWGAFGAGFLKGWGRISGPEKRPEFDIVTGVSTGALIAPFAFLGDEESIDKVVHLYRNPKKDWVKQRWPLYFLPHNMSFAEVPGLEREVREQLTDDMIGRIAQQAEAGRVLVVNTTNVDDASQRPWDLAAECQRARETGDMERVRNIMLASAGIPGAFPFRIIDNEMYVDGGVTGNILYGGRIRDEDSLAAVWQKQYPDVAAPKVRYWVIFNNQFHPPPQVTEPTWPAVVVRSLEMATRSSTATAMRHLHARTEIMRLKHKADVEVRIVAIPNDWFPPKPGVFIKETMNALADLGEQMGADPKIWSSEPPP